MGKAVSENEKAIWPGRPRWLRVPSFTVAWMLSVAVLLALIAWMFVDASLRHAIDTSLVVMRVRPNPDYDLKSRVAWDQLGGRITLLVVIVVLGVAANAVVAFRLLIGRAGGRSILAYLAATVLVGVWLSFFLRYGELEWRGFTFRLARRVPELKVLFEQLRDQWPRADGALPAVGSYRLISKLPNEPDALLLTDTRPPFPIAEPLGPFMQRRSSGVIEIDLRTIVSNIRNGTWTGYCVIELHPTQSEPADFRQAFEHATNQCTLQGSERLGDSVYLAWYECVSRVKDDDGGLPRGSEGGRGP